MPQSFLWLAVSPLVVQSPLLIACLVGAILGIINFPRRPTVGMLLALGCGIQFFAVIVFALSQAYFTYQRMENGWSTSTMASMMSILGFAGGIARATGVSLLIAAALVGRGPSQPDFEPIRNGSFRN